MDIVNKAFVGKDKIIKALVGKDIIIIKAFAGKATSGYQSFCQGQAESNSTLTVISFIFVFFKDRTHDLYRAR
jgi:hypothetical protein